MADHVRQQLREAVAAAVTGLATTGANVFESRFDPVRTLPCLLVYTTSEAVTVESLDEPAFQRRDVEVRVEGLAMANDDLDDTLDEIAKEVETALAAPITVDGKDFTLVYTGAEIELRRDVERPTGAVTLTFTTDLYTLASAPDALIQS